MSRRGVVTAISILALVWMAIGLLLPSAAHASRPLHGGRTVSAPVAMQSRVGYGGFFRGNPAWTPIAVRLHNLTDTLLSGVVEIPDPVLWYPSQIVQRYSASYDMAVVLPPFATKQVTLHVPGSDMRGDLTVSFKSGGSVLAEQAVHPSQWDDSVITVGALTSDPSETTWLPHSILLGMHRAATVDVVDLAPASVDVFPEALANFDVIAITDVDTSSLDADQRDALVQYVRNGGALLLVGGPGWQETLPGLPPGLLPGRLAGSRVVGGLGELGALVGAAAPPGKTTVSVLARARGNVEAWLPSPSRSRPKPASGVPLIVQRGLGNGHVEYLAFDPAVDPVAHWPGRSVLLPRLIREAAPLAIRRLSLPSPYWSPWLLNPSNWSSWFLDSDGQPLDTISELSNTRLASLPPVLPVAILVVLCVVLARRVRALLNRRVGRPDLNWIAISAITMLLLVPPSALAFGLKGQIALVNTVNAVVVSGDGSRQQATMHVGLFTPLPGDYSLRFDGPALPYSDMPPTPLAPGLQVGAQGRTSPSWRFTEGAQTSIDAVSMGIWETRALALRASVDLGGTIQSAVYLTAAGDIVGALTNRSRLTLLDPAIVAGGAAIHLHAMPPGATASFRIRPAGFTGQAGGSADTSMLVAVYGQASFRKRWIGCDGGQLPFPSGNNGSVYMAVQRRPYGCAAPSRPREDSTADRIRNAISMLPEARILSLLAEVSFVAWSETPLTSFTVAGETPRHRDITLIVKPLSVSFPHHSFLLRPGTLGGHLVDMTPVTPQRWCCFPTVQPVSLGEGGSASVQFDIPDTRDFRFVRLALTLPGNGVRSADPGQPGVPRGVGFAYDWFTRRWDSITFHADTAALAPAARYVSPTGALLVKLQATHTTGDITMLDVHRDLQLSGFAVAR